MSTAEIHLPTAAEEAQLFWRLRGRLMANIVRQTLGRSRLRLLLVVFLSGVFWLGLFVLFVDAFQFLEQSVPNASIRDLTVRTIYGVFFVSLMVMLVFSAGIVLYGGLFRSPEVQFLLTTPVRVDRIFLYKFQEAMLLSSWGFILLGSPMLVAHGQVVVAPWYYYVMLLPYLVAFSMIPGAIGAILCLIVVYLMPRQRRTAVYLGTAAILVLAIWTAWRLATGPQTGLLTPSWFQDMLERLRFSQARLLPSWWLSMGLLETSRGAWSESVLFLALLIANAMFLHQIALATAGRLFRAAYSRRYDHRHSYQRRWGDWLDRLFQAAIFYLPERMRILLIKDLRLFRRDPVQWSQFLIFFALLATFFLNIRRLSYDINHATWVNMVSFLNLAVVGLIMSTFTSRFIFPAISLEGRRFWVLGRLPIRRESILWSKFLFAAIGSIVPCGILIVLSDVMLRVLPIVLFVHLLTCVLLCIGLSGMAVGLGAKMPNFREESPTKIAAGFGGTLNLVLSAIYIVVVVLLTAVPCHFYLVANQSEFIGRYLEMDTLRNLIFLGLAGSIVVSALATIVPLRMGLRAFRELEF